MDLNGPPLLVDSVFTVLSLILEKRNATAHSLLLQPEERLLRWFTARWRPVDGLDRLGTSVMHLSAAKIVGFLLTCLGERGGIIPNSTVQSSKAEGYCGPIARACIKSTKEAALLSYLLLEDEDKEAPTEADKAEYSPLGLSAPALAMEYRLNVNALLNDFLEREACNMNERWHSLTEMNAKNITPIVLQALTTFLLTASAAFTIGSRGLKPSETLRDKMKSLEVQLADYLRRHDCTEAHVNAVLDCISPLLPSLQAVLGVDHRPHAIYQQIYGDVLISVIRAIETRLNTKEDDTDVDMEEFDLPVRRGLRKNARESESIPREALEATHCSDATRSLTIALLNLLLRSHSSDPINLSKTFRKYLMGLPTHRLLLLKPVLHQVLETTILSIDDAVLLMEHLGSNILSKYEFRSCETTIDFVLSAIKALVLKWVPPGSNADLVHICGIIYEWMTGARLEKNTTSHTVRMSIALTLQRILEIDKFFKTKESETSARTLFIFLLKDLDIRVKYLMAETAPALFEIYPVSQHLDVYKDIHNYLDREDRLEGLAMRCFTLSRLASASHTTKRRVVYYIFETALIRGAEVYATRCVAAVSKVLGLKSSRYLFKIFSSQLIFTWILSHGLDSIPYKVCGYSTRDELFMDMKEEVVAQLLMHDQDDDAEDIAKRMGISYEQLLQDCFHRIIAYGTAWAIQTPKQEGGSKQPPVESRVRKRLGDALYKSVSERSFPQVVATLFQAMEQDGKSEKLLSRDSGLVSAKLVMDDIVNIAASDTALLEPLKPAFKIKVVLNALHHICRRLGYDEGKLWSPPIFTYVARKLFDTIDPGLGPLHACTVIRKIRLLVCLAGKTVHEGYPLEMLIHGLRPFIIDTFCAQDTVGVVQYLFINGKNHLQRNPTFVVSTFLSIMASLRAFIATVPDSQVDSSQFHGSQTTAQSFHSWLCNYLSGYNTSEMSITQADTFNSLVESAIGFKSHGNAFYGTKESELLQVLLTDEAEEHGLLDDSSRQLAFSLISSDFKRPNSFREDIFGHDEKSMAISKALLRTCRNYNVSHSYLMWSARVLGRAYAASGIIHNEWTQEAELVKETDLPRDGDFAVTPKSAILKQVTRLLFSEDREEVALVEITLIDIFHLENRGQTLITELAVPLHLLRALGWDTPPECPPRVPHSSTTLTSAGRIGDRSLEDWIKGFTIAISLSCPCDAVGNRVAPLLHSVEGFAEKLFPYLVHLLLILEAKAENAELTHALSEAFRFSFKQRTESSIPHMIALIKTILYLRTQEKKAETTKLARDDWLDLDYLDLAKAACVCKMFRTALLFVEIYCSRGNSDYNKCTDLLLEIYKNVDDPDSFYGLNQGASLNAVINKLEYEEDGWKSLSFRGAQMESSMRLGAGLSADASDGAVGALNILGLHGLSHSFLQSGTLGFTDEATLGKVYESAWRLEQWNLPCPRSYTCRAPMIYRTLQNINNTINTNNILSELDLSFLEIMKQITAGKQTGNSLGASIRTLAMLTEVEEIVSSANSVQLHEVWRKLVLRTAWMKTAR